MRTSKVHYIAPSAISITPNANNSHRDLAVYIARGTKIKVHSKSVDRLGVNPNTNAYREWTLEGRNRRLADTTGTIPYTIYARLPKSGFYATPDNAYLVFARKYQYENGDGRWYDKHSYVMQDGLSGQYDERGFPKVVDDENYWWIRLGDVSAAVNGQRTVTLDTGILGTDQYNEKWDLNPDDLPLRVELTCTVNGEDAGPTPYLYWGQSALLAARIVEGWTADASAKVDHWTITRLIGNEEVLVASSDSSDSSSSDEGERWPGSVRAALFNRDQIITLFHVNEENDDFLSAAGAVFRVTAWGIDNPLVSDSSDSDSSGSDSSTDVSDSSDSSAEETIYVPLGTASINIYVETNIIGTKGDSSIAIFRWYKDGLTPVKPVDTSSAEPNAADHIEDGDAYPSSKWSKNAINRPLEGEWALWMCTSTRHGNGIIDAWSDPVRISGTKGTPGEDAKDREWVYKRGDTSTLPAAPQYVNFNTNDMSIVDGNVQSIVESLDDTVVAGGDLVIAGTTVYEYDDDEGEYTVVRELSVADEGAAYYVIEKDGWFILHNGKWYSVGETLPSTYNGMYIDDYVPVGWHDNASHPDVLISPEHRFLYASWRDYDNETKRWGDFQGPTIRSVWGERGIDGDGVQYIFKLFDHELTDAERNSNIANNIEKNESGEWMPVSDSSNSDSSNSDSSDSDDVNAGWHDDPPSPTPSLRYCYCSAIRQINGTWGTFGKLGLWSKYSVVYIGDDGYWYIDGVKTDVKAEGKDGTGVEIKGTVDVYANSDKDVSAQPPQTSLQEVTGMLVGYCYIVEANRHLYFYLGTGSWPWNWRDLGEFKGEPGLSSYMHIAYATWIRLDASGNAIGQTGFTVVKNSDSYAWIGFCTDNNEHDPGSQARPNADGGGAAYTAYKWNYIKGIDGNGNEHVYMRTKTKTTAPTVSNSSSDSYTENGTTYTPASDEYRPPVGNYNSSNMYADRWTDDPMGCTATWKFEWEAIRKKIDGTWGDFTVTPNPIHEFTVTKFLSRVFCKWPTQPAAPDNTVSSSYNTFDNPVPPPVNGQPTWTDGIPSTGDGFVWSSFRWFYNDNTTDTWSTPQMEADTNDLDIEFAFLQDSDTQPAAPVDGTSGNRHGTTGTQIWFDPVLDANSLPSGKTWSDMVWRAERELVNGQPKTGAQWVITRINGEQGEPGVSPTVYNLMPTVDSVKFSRDSNNSFIPSSITVGCGLEKKVGNERTYYEAGQELPSGEGLRMLYRLVKADGTHVYIDGRTVSSIESNNALDWAWMDTQSDNAHQENGVWTSDNTVTIQAARGYVALEFAIISTSPSHDRLNVNENLIIDKKRIPILYDGTNGNNGDSPVVYTLQCTPAAVNFRSDAVGNFFGSYTVSCKVMKTVGDVTSEVTASDGTYDGMYLKHHELRTSGSYNSWAQASSITLNPEAAIESLFVATEFALATDSSMTHIVARAGVPITLDGRIGATGAAGRMFRPRGTYNDSATYVRNSEFVDLVFFDDGSTNNVNSARGHYYYVSEGKTSNVSGSTHYAPASTDGDGNNYNYQSGFWTLADDFAVVITQAVFAEYAKMGSAIMSGDYMYSAYANKDFVMLSTEVSKVGESYTLIGNQTALEVRHGVQYNLVVNCKASSSSYFYCRVYYLDSQYDPTQSSNWSSYGIQGFHYFSTNSDTYEDYALPFMAEYTGWVKLYSYGNGYVSRIAAKNIGDYTNVLPMFINNDAVNLLAYGAATTSSTSSESPGYLFHTPIPVRAGMSYRLDFNARVNTSGATFYIGVYDGNSRLDYVAVNSTTDTAFQISFTANADGSVYIKGYTTSGSGVMSKLTITPQNPYVPTVAVNWLTGYAHFAGDNVRFNPDGSGKLAAGNITWDSAGNARFNGNVNATSGEFTGTVRAQLMYSGTQLINNTNYTINPNSNPANLYYAIYGQDITIHLPSAQTYHGLELRFLNIGFPDDGHFGIKIVSDYNVQNINIKNSWGTGLTEALAVHIINYRVVTLVSANQQWWVVDGEVRGTHEQIIY